MVYNNSEGEYGKYIIQELQDPQAGTPEFREMYKRFSHRILWYHLLTRSSLIFCPAGMPHMQLSIKKVDRPVFHFSVVTGPEYKGGAYGSDTEE